MPATDVERSTSIRAKAAHIASIAAAAADDVDTSARFPSEATAAMKAERMMSALVPQRFGGFGWSVADIAGVCTVLGESCSASAMVFAMHQIQVACIVRHSQESQFFADRLISLAEKQSLLASATSEIGVGGDTRSSVCAIEMDGADFSIVKQAPVISYGAHADGFLVTARRAADAPANDQVLAYLERANVTLKQTGDWNTLGFRGTCSPGFVFNGRAPRDSIIPSAFAEISSRTMLPVSHIVWASLWLGIANAAVSKARGFVRAEARKSAGKTPPAAMRLADVVATLDRLRSTVGDAVGSFERLASDDEELSSMRFAIRMNNLKLSASALLIEIVTQCMLICGMAAYKIDSPYALGRHLRDAFGAAIMINNDRIYSANAAMLLVSKDE